MAEQKLPISNFPDHLKYLEGYVAELSVRAATGDGAGVIAEIERCTDKKEVWEAWNIHSRRMSNFRGAA